MASQRTQHDDVMNPMLPAYLRGLPVSPTEALFLTRLSRLLQLEEEWRVQSSSDWRLRLIHQGIYSTYCDCLEVGVSLQAQELIRRFRTSDRS